MSRAPPAPLELLVGLEQPDPSALPDLLALRASSVQLAPQVLLVLLVQQGPQATLALLVLRVSQAPPALRVLLVRQVPLERRASSALLDQTEQPA